MIGMGASYRRAAGPQAQMLKSGETGRCLQKGLAIELYL